MEFARQEYLWLLLSIPVVILCWALGLWRQQQTRSNFGNIQNLEPISRISWSGKQWLRGLLFPAALVLMALALASPSAIIRELRAIPTPTDLVFLLDMSPSMYGRDMDPSRLGRAERIVQRFIYLKRPDDRYGLITFTWSSVVLSYMTKDPQTILLYFDYLNRQNVPQPGTNVGAALSDAMQLMAKEQQIDPPGSPKRRTVFVLISDGDDTAHELDQPLAQVIRSGIKIYTIGLGTANGTYVPLQMDGGLNGRVVSYWETNDGTRIISHAEVKTMREIAERTGGRYYRGEDDKKIEQAVDEILFASGTVSGFQSNAVRKDIYTYFLVAAFACLSAGVFL